MSLIDFLHAVALGLVEGLTEFLPISSTGHMIIVGEFLDFQGPPGKLLEIAIQLGAILAVCWLYRVKLFGIVRDLPRSADARRFVVNILLAFFPAAIIGVLAYRTITELLFSPWVVAVALILGGIAILIIERLPLVTRPRIRFDGVEGVTPSRALMIGFIQCLAMIPGTSRAAATIMGALLMGLTRRTATEFSFILAIPTMLGAAVYSLYKNRAAITADNLELIGVGFAVAFVVALLVVRWMINFVSRHGFAPFAYYRIIVGGALIVLLSA
jgi:undecaprenyl-diphosphatase